MTTAEIDAFIQAARRLRCDLGVDAATKILAYTDSVLVRNERVNLTGPCDRESARLRHALDSLAFSLHVEAEPGPIRSVLDFGSGGGFPGVPIAAAYPQLRVVLLDATRKKIDAVRELSAAAGVSIAEACWGRAEEIARSRRELRRAFDAVTARAVGPLAELVGFAAPFVRAGGAVVAWKSTTLADEERRAGDAMAASWGFKPLPDVRYLSDRESQLVRYRRTP